MTSEPATVFFEQIVILRPVGARCDGGEAVADTDAKSNQKLVDGPAGTNGGKGGIAQHIADDHGIHGIIELLEQVGDEDGQHEQQQVFENEPVQSGPHSC